MTKFLLAAIILLAGLAASKPVLADTVSITLLGAGNAKAYGYYVGPMTANVGGSAIQVVCDDFSHNVSVGQSWTATVNMFNNLSGTRFGSDLGAEFKYQEAAWLVDQFATHPSATGDIQFAIWSLFTPSVPTNASISAWLNLAASQNFTNYDFSGFRIFTPTSSGCNSPQEFIAKIPGAQVPEPTTLSLLGGGLAAISVLLKRNRKKVD